MKSILCPTDFSQEANHAIEAGFYLAKKFKIGLDLFHIVEASSETEFNIQGASGGGGSSIDDIFFMKLIESTKKRLAELANTPGLEDIEVTQTIKIGKPSKFIMEELHKDKHSMVVMGTTGDSGFHEIMIGSNTEKVVRLSKIPVLAVKEFVDESNFKNIVFATSMREEELVALEPVKMLQDAFGSTIHLVRINTPNNFETDVLAKKEMENYAKKYGITNYTVNIYNNAIEEDGIILFAEEIDAGMIAMATHGRTGFSHLISGSVAEDVVNHAKRPVLTVNIG